MLAIRSLLRNNRQIVNNAVQQRNMTAISTPARNKITKGETVVLAGAMVVGWTVVPAWVLVNIKNYRDRE